MDCTNAGWFLNRYGAALVAVTLASLQAGWTIYIARSRRQTSGHVDRRASAYGTCTETDGADRQCSDGGADPAASPPSCVLAAPTRSRAWVNDDVMWDDVAFGCASAAVICALCAGGMSDVAWVLLTPVLLLAGITATYHGTRALLD